MNVFKIIFIFFFSFLLFNNAKSFTDKEGKGSQSDGREDLSFLDVKNSNFKKGIDATKRALKFEKKNKPKKAKKYFEKALRYFVLAHKEYPNNIEILNNLGFTHYKFGDLIMSEIYYEEALTIDPKNPEINQRLGEIYINTKRINLAKERLNAMKICNCEEYLILKNILEKDY
jgi:tetratricopeptide (TPR) repeat protein